MMQTPILKGRQMGGNTAFGKRKPAGTRQDGSEQHRDVYATDQIIFSLGHQMEAGITGLHRACVGALFTFEYVPLEVLTQSLLKQMHLSIDGRCGAWERRRPGRFKSGSLKNLESPTREFQTHSHDSKPPHPPKKPC